MKNILLFAAVATLTSTAAWADTTKADPAREDQMVCKMIRETGSRLSKTRICQTRGQWIAQRRAQRDDLERAQSRRVEPANN